MATATTSPAATQGEDRTATTQLKDKTAVVRDELKELGRLTKDASREQLERARKQAGQLGDHLVEYVREHPTKAMLYAAGAGAVLGFLLRRR